MELIEARLRALEILLMQAVSVLMVRTLDDNENTIAFLKTHFETVLSHAELDGEAYGAAKETARRHFREVEALIEFLQGGK